MTETNFTHTNSTMWLLSQKCRPVCDKDELRAEGERRRRSTVGVSLSEACALSENHPLSEALRPLSELGEYGGESTMHLRAQRVISSLNE